MMSSVPILLYHSVSSDVSVHFRKWSVSPQLFMAHMSYLADHDYQPLTVSEYVELMAEHRLPAQPVVITFDDGFADFRMNALPVLRRYEFPSTLYLTTGYVDATSRWLDREGEGERPMLTWSDVKEMASDDLEYGAHSHSHRQLDTLSATDARSEILRSKQELEQRLVAPVKSFAYPHGFHSPTIRAMVQQSGFTSACGVKHALSHSYDDPFALARVIITADTSLEAFGKLMTGEGLRLATRRELLRTKAWRVARRSATFAHSSSSAAEVLE